jgi:glutaconyl-CoA decarboxylase
MSNCMPIEAAVEAVKNAGFPAEKINARGQMTVWQRLDYLVDPGTWCPLHTLYNPYDNEGTTNVIDGLGKISGKWAVIIGFDNKVMAGAWLPGQAENILRVTDLAKRLNIPWSGWSTAAGSSSPSRKSSMPTAADRHHLLPPCRTRAAGHPGAGRHLRHQPGRRRLPGHQPHRSVRPQELQHRRGRRRHLSGMSPKGYFDWKAPRQLISAAKQFKVKPPGSG